MTKARLLEDIVRAAYHYDKRPMKLYSAIIEAAKGSPLEQEVTRLMNQARERCLTSDFTVE